MAKSLQKRSKNEDNTTESIILQNPQKSNLRHNKINNQLSKEEIRELILNKNNFVYIAANINIQLNFVFNCWPKRKKQ